MNPDITAMIEALKFYASENSYRGPIFHFKKDGKLKSDEALALSPVIEDRGDRARKALELAQLSLEGWQ